jgi:DNA-directed RNA polymerase subunit RPC12/RpoP
MDAIRRFMQGRYGSDALTLFLMCVGIGLNIVSMFVPFVSFLALAIFAFAVWRMLSRNIYARQKENAAYLRGWQRVKSFFSGLGPRADAKTHKHYKCPECRQEVRVPKGKGKILITCPRCGKKFEKKT